VVLSVCSSLVVLYNISEWCCFISGSSYCLPELLSPSTLNQSYLSLNGVKPTLTLASRLLSTQHLRELIGKPTIYIFFLLMYYYYYWVSYLVFFPNLSIKYSFAYWEGQLFKLRERIKVTSQNELNHAWIIIWITIILFVLQEYFKDLFTSVI